MRRIYKYPFKGWPGDVVPIEMPQGAEILDAQIQGYAGVQLWARVDPEAPTEIRNFRAVGTGWEVSGQGWSYIATVQEGPFVWHIFEQVKVG